MVINTTYILIKNIVFHKLKNKEPANGGFLVERDGLTVPTGPSGVTGSAGPTFGTAYNEKLT